MAVPCIVPELFPVILSDTFSKPARHDKARNGIGYNPVGITIQDVRSPLRFILEPLEIDRRNLTAKFERCLNLDNVSKFVGHDIPKPVMCATEVEVERRRPNFYFIVKKVCATVRIIIIIFNNETYFAIGFMMIERGYRVIDILGNFSNRPGSTFGSRMIMNIKMLCLNGKPLKSGIRLKLRI